MARRPGPIRRGGIETATQIGATSNAAIPVVTMPTAKIRAAASDSSTAWRVSGSCGRADAAYAPRFGAGPSIASAVSSMSPAGTSGRAGSIDDRTTPPAMQPRTTTEPRASGSPRAMASTAASAPSVATIGATIETLPTVRAR